MAEFSYQLVEDVAKELYIKALKYLQAAASRSIRV